MVCRAWDLAKRQNSTSFALAASSLCVICVSGAAEWKLHDCLNVELCHHCVENGVTRCHCRPRAMRCEGTRGHGNRHTHAHTETNTPKERDTEREQKGRIKWSQRKIHKQICEAIFIKLNFPSAKYVAASLLHIALIALTHDRAISTESRQQEYQKRQAPPFEWFCIRFTLCSAFFFGVCVCAVAAVRRLRRSFPHRSRRMRVAASILIVGFNAIRENKVNAKCSSFASYMYICTNCVLRAIVCAERAARFGSSREMRSTRTTFSVH